MLNEVLLAAEESAQIKPLGWVLIIGFAIAVVFGVLHDKKKASGFASDFASYIKENAIDNVGSIYITKNKELIFCDGNSTSLQVGCLKFGLENVAYMMAFFESDIHTNASQKYVVGLYDSKKKLIKGVRQTSANKSFKATADFILDSKEEVEAFYTMLSKYVSNVEKVGKFFKDYNL